jgi:hypothetical protein
MALEEILKELGEEKAAVIAGAIEAEKQAGISAAHAKSSEIKKWMTEANRLRDEKRALGLEPDADLSEFVSSLKAEPKQKPISDAERKLNATLKEIDEYKTRLQKEQEKNARAAIYSEATKHLESVPARDYVIKAWIADGKVKVDESGRVLMVEGDTDIPLDKAVDVFIKNNPHLVSSGQRPGSGSAGSTSMAGKKVMRVETFDGLTQKEKAAYMADGGKIID